MTAAAASTKRAYQRRRRRAAQKRLESAVENLQGCLYGVSGLERKVLALRAGLGPARALPRTGAARRLGISSSRVSVVERRGLRSLRRTDRRDGCGGSGVRSVLGASSPANRVAALTRMVTRLGPVVEHAAGLGGDRGRRPADRNEVKGAHAESGSRRPDRGSQATGGKRGSEGTGDGDDFPPLIILLAAAALAGALGGLAHRLRGGRSSDAGKKTARRHRAAPLASRTPEPVKCSYCRSQECVVNPAQGVYRCASCGFTGPLSSTVETALDNIDQDPRTGAGRQGS